MQVAAHLIIIYFFILQQLVYLLVALCLTKLF